MPSAIFNAYLVFISLVSLVMLLMGTRSYKQEKPNTTYSPKILVIVPCKGSDLTLEENLRAIKNQKYPNYKIICVVDDKNDESLLTIKRLKINWMLSRSNCNGCSGKVRAIASAIELYKEYPVYAIADSDILPEQEWLANLVAPLGDAKVGISTGYPFFNPVEGFWSKVKSAWGLVGEGLMESRLTVFGWGGSLAFRKDLLDKKSMLLFNESLSDDIALTKIAKKKRLKIFYSRDVKLQVNVRENLGEFMEWANRQTALSILGDGKIFYFGITFYLAQILVLLSGIILGISYGFLFFMLLLPILIGALRGYRRLRKKYFEFFLIILFLPFLYFANLLVAKSMKEIKWRGKKYLLN